MLKSVRKKTSQDDEESVFISMTDLTISFLIILMILLAFFASRLTDEDQVPREKLVQAEMKILSLEAKVTQLELLLGEANKQNVELQAEVAALEQTVEVLTLQNAERNRTISSLLAEVKNLEEQLALLRLEKYDLQLQKVELEEELVSLKARLADLLKLAPDPEERPETLEGYLREAEYARQRILNQIENYLLDVRKRGDKLDIAVSDTGSLRIYGDGMFARNQARLLPEAENFVKELAFVLNDILPCYSLGQSRSFRAECNPSFAVVEAIFVEGHTDSTGGQLVNVRLSADRAVAAWSTMVEAEDQLLSYENANGQPVLSVAGYGEERPIADNETNEGRNANRRIDIRIIMHTPGNLDQVEDLKVNLLATNSASGSS